MVKLVCYYLIYRLTYLLILSLGSSLCQMWNCFVADSEPKYKEPHDLVIVDSCNLFNNSHLIRSPSSLCSLLLVLPFV